MRQLEGKSSEILNQIFSELHIDTNPYRFWEKERHLDKLSAEIFWSQGPVQTVALAHTFIQHGDVMKDPEVVFLRTRNGGGTYNFSPISFENSLLGVFKQSSRGEISEDDLCDFCDIWMTNIQDQRGVLDGNKGETPYHEEENLDDI
jgi:hypothetical protein